MINVYLAFVEFEHILIIQTAFIGDVVLATSLLEKMHDHYPKARIDFLLRKGNENLLEKHPFLNDVIIWDKRTDKMKNLIALIKRVRRSKYDLVVNVQRFGATGLLTMLSGAKVKVGFRKNPFSFSFTHRVEHQIGDCTHEVERNLKLIEQFTDEQYERPVLYIPDKAFERVKMYQDEPYITIAPTSVWYTKQFPAHKWIEFIKSTDFKGKIYLLGAPSDSKACEEIVTKAGRKKVENLCGLLNFLESAALMKEATMNYVNDSAPMHFASAVNAPTTVVFCSTIPEFGFGPLADLSRVVQVSEPLACRPCGLHGHKKCPEGHFKCAELIDVERL